MKSKPLDEDEDNKSLDLSASNKFLEKIENKEKKQCHEIVKQKIDEINERYIKE